MKKITILMVVVVMTASLTLNFSDVKAQEIAIGIKAGANLANIGDIPGDESPDMLIGAHIGPFIKLPLSEEFSIIPEILFSMKGAKFGDNPLSLSYIDIPVMANYQLESGLFFELGPYVGILLAADADGTDVKEVMSSVDFGLGLGLGYRLENGLGFGARYNLGLATINEEQSIEVPVIDPNSGLVTGTTTQTTEAYGKNSNIMISVSWLFGQN